MSKIQVNDIVNHFDDGAPNFPKGIVVGSGATLGFNVGTGASIYSPSDNVLTLGTNNVERVRVDSAGKVGVGTDNPGSPLEVNGGSGLDVATFNSHHADGPLINVQRSGTAIGFVGSGKNLHATTGSDDALSIRSQAEFTIATGGSTERLRITSAGNVGINQTLPTSQSGKVLHISGDTGGQARIHLSTSASGHGTNDGHYIVSQGAESGSVAGQLAFINMENRNFVFTTGTEGANVTRLTIQHDGNLNIADGNLVVANGHGIDFSATADGAGSSQNELFDDYEFGNWIPVIKSGSNVITVTDTTQSYFRYIKIGRLVKLFFCLNNATTSGSTGGTCTIGGLPFAVVSETNNRFISGDAMYYNSGFMLSGWPIYPHLAAGDTTMNLYQKGSSSAPYGSVTVSNVGSNGYFFFTIEYYTS